ncbi:MAG TPA: Rieske (2Fe-2S) protein, partial [Urbifossiella sp.]
MGVLDHWHPVLKSRELRRKPVGVKIAGQPIAVFRTAGGGLGAVEDICPHRRLKLSAGNVIGERLQC